MTAGSGVRGCAATASVTMTPSTGGMIGRMVFCDGENIQMLYSGGAVCTFGSAMRASEQGTMRVGSTVSNRRHCVQLTRIRPEPSHSGKPELKRPPGEG